MTGNDLRRCSGETRLPAAWREILACPECRGDLREVGEVLMCAGCGSEFAVEDGIPLLAAPGWSERPVDLGDGPSSHSYKQRFRGAESADNYRRIYERRLSKRLATRREVGRIREILDTLPRCRRLLDLPCGGGRVSGPMREAADFLIQADIGLGQVRLARDSHQDQGDGLWFTASGFGIPMKDEVVDGAVCNRLTHHLPTIAEVDRLVSELLRVSRDFVLLSYYDHASVKSLSRRLRGKEPGHTLRRRDLRELASRHGPRVEADLPLWFAGSRLRYALLRRIPT